MDNNRRPCPPSLAQKDNGLLIPISYRIRFKTRDSGKDCKEWNNAPGYLIDTCLTAQDNYKARLEYFRIKQ